MPLPLIPALLGGAAAVAGVAGVGSAVSGASKMKKANNTMKEAEERHQKNLEKFEIQNEKTTYFMDELGKKELEILETFDEFTALIEKIHNKPEFKAYVKNGVQIPEYNPEELNKVSVGAGVLLGGLGGAAMGTAGGFAAAGVTTSAVMALGTASTGTAIASLSGAAATNATLAALGGGALAAGGGGMALGASVLSAATLGAGLLVGGILFNVTGSKISNKAEDAKEQVLKMENDINKICDYLVRLYDSAHSFKTALLKVTNIYDMYFKSLQKVILIDGKIDWNSFTDREKILAENTVLLVGLLYNMCKVQLVVKDIDNDELNEVNTEEINKAINDSKEVLESLYV